MNGRANAHRYLRAVGSEAQRLAARVDLIYRGRRMTRADADTTTPDELLRAGGPWIYVFRSCTACGRTVHWVAGVGISPGHWAHREPRTGRSTDSRLDRGDGLSEPHGTRTRLRCPHAA